MKLGGFGATRRRRALEATERLPTGRERYELEQRILVENEARFVAAMKDGRAFRTLVDLPPPGVRTSGADGSVVPLWRALADLERRVEAVETKTGLRGSEA